MTIIRILWHRHEDERKQIDAQKISPTLLYVCFRHHCHRRRRRNGKKKSENFVEINFDRFIKMSISIFHHSDAVRIPHEKCTKSL